MPVARRVKSESRVIAHIDMDCFYVQGPSQFLLLLLTFLNYQLGLLCGNCMLLLWKQPQLRGLPTAVVQYNEWKGGALIAVSYEARNHAVKRSMRGDEARNVCPEIQLIQVPVARGKADLSAYRDAGSEVISILSRKGRCERASIDEVYLDLTDAAETMLAENPPESLDDIDEEATKSHILGLDRDNVKENVKLWLRQSDADHNSKLLSCGALIVAELRKQVLRETEFTCSAGIAHNKMLAKLASGLNKPAQQTVVPAASVKEFLGPWPIKKMKQLGGKLGDSLQSELGVNTVGDLLQLSEQKLQELYGFNTGTWLWNIARGISGEEVQGRILPKSHGSGKTFPGPRALRSMDTVSHWLKQLCEELSERLLADLDQNKRIAHTLTLHVKAYKSSDTDSQKKFHSKSCPLRYGTSKIQEDALSLFHAGLREFMGTYGVKSDKNQNNGWGVTGLSISASKITSVPQGTCTIKRFFSRQCAFSSTSSEETSNVSTQFPDNVLVENCNWNLEADAFIGKDEATCMHNLSGLDHDYKETKTPNNQEVGIVTRNSPEQAISRSRSMLEKATTSYSVSENATGTSSLLDEATIAAFDQVTNSCSLLDQTTDGRTLQLERKEIVQDNSQYKFDDIEPPMAARTPNIHDHEVKISKSKETVSILKFLKKPGSQLNHTPTGIQRELDVKSYSGGNMLQNVQNAGKRERWNYHGHEIDPTIVKELPLDIQEELWGWMRSLKQHHSPKRGRITSYFLPSKGPSN